MKGDDRIEPRLLGLRYGPIVWAISAVLGLIAGALATRLLPPSVPAGGDPVIPLILVVPFAALLASIALMPFVSQRIWHRHYPDFAFALAGVVAGYYLAGFKDYGLHRLTHAFAEYYSFIALVGGLYVVSGGILVRTRGQAGPLANTLLLAFGAVLANVVGTTGASVLLIRPFMRLNQGRLRPLHVVMFIFIVSNCGGCLTPIGDPPLYLGFLKGIPFTWTLVHLVRDWFTVVLPLLGVFFVVDSMTGTRDPGAERPHLSIRGGTGLFGLALMILGVFIDPIVEKFTGVHGVPIGATFQILVAIGAYLMAPRQLLSENEFTFEPVKEVGLLFVGIFITMVPALGYLSANGPSLGLASPTSYYLAAGGLSAVLDNAPTYLNFLQIAMAPDEITPEGLRAYIATLDGRQHVIAISTGAVFFGAMTYIGNGPNFMVRAIAEAAGVRMPSFFGYVGWALLILAPILALHWYILIR
jgi:Na+/H+ antiporter NhaD/arsenite permease-like protein